ncbi:hypothetical protein Tco_1330278 [Tanacetum coccineum]
MKSQQSTNNFVKETFMDLKTQLEIVAKNHQASIQNLETKFDRLADKQSGRPSGSLSSSTQLNPKGHNSKAYQPPQSCNEHVNAVFTRSDLRKCLDMIRAIRINVPLVGVLAGMPNYGKFLKELISNKHKIAAFLSDESSAMIQNKVSPKLGDPGSFLILFVKFTFPADFVILEMEKSVKKNFLYFRTTISLQCDAVMSSLRRNNSILDIEVIDEILEEDFDAILDEGSKILYSIERTLLKEEIFAEFDEFMAMTADENSDYESDHRKTLTFEKFTSTTIIKIKESLKTSYGSEELIPLLII